MKINLDKEAREFIEGKSKQNSINISVVQAKTGWCTTMQLSVKMGNPRNINKFNLYEVDGINIYLEQGLIVPSDEISISLKKIMFFKTLSVVGIYV